jgi:hypothetical protein
LRGDRVLLIELFAAGNESLPTVQLAGSIAIVSKDFPDAGQAEWIR